MAAPTSLIVETDLEEYSRFEEERDSILVTITLAGTSLLDEQVQVELRKARRGRDEIVATKTLTADDSVAKAYTVTFSLPDIVDDRIVPKVRRGNYFIRAISVTNPAIEEDSEDFKVSLISIARLKADYLHGTDQFSSDQLLVVEQPKKITGVTVEDVSRGHPAGWTPLSYNFAIHRHRGHVRTIRAFRRPDTRTPGRWQRCTHGHVQHGRLFEHRCGNCSRGSGGHYDRHLRCHGQRRRWKSPDCGREPVPSCRPSRHGDHRPGFAQPECSFDRHSYALVVQRTDHGDRDGDAHLFASPK